MARRETFTWQIPGLGAQHEKYVNFILPRHPREVTFQETIQILTKIFGTKFTVLY